MQNGTVKDVSGEKLFNERSFLLLCIWHSDRGTSRSVIITMSYNYNILQPRYLALEETFFKQLIA